LHNSALHGGKDEGSQGVKIGMSGKPIPRVLQESAHRSSPSREVRRDAGMRRQVLGLNFQSQAADRTSVLATCRDEALAVALKNTKDTLHGIGECCLSRLHDYRMQPVQVAIEQRQQQRFLALEKVIETAAIRLRPFE
jgi:hypothetical protein